MSLQRRALSILVALGLVVGAGAFLPQSAIAATNCNGWVTQYKIVVSGAVNWLVFEQDFCTSDSGATWTWSGYPKYSQSANGGTAARLTQTGWGVYNMGDGKTVDSWINFLARSSAGTLTFNARIKFSRTGCKGCSPMLPYSYGDSTTNWGWSGSGSWSVGAVCASLTNTGNNYCAIL